MNIEELLLLTPHLPLRERAIVQGVYQNGITLATMSRLAKEDIRRVHRRLHRALDRMASPEFRFVATHGRYWPADRRAIAQAIILHGQTQRSAARSLRTTVYRVRQELNRIQALIEVHSPPPPSL